jgi:3-oxoacyl-[acyl-carrier-protein] synthase-1
MSKGVAITGMGMISSIGNTVEENFQSLIDKKPGISRIKNIETIHKNVIKVGEIDISNDELEQILNLSPENNYSRTAMLAEIAAKEAVKNAGIGDMQKYRTGLISATSVGGMDMTERYYYSYHKEEKDRKYIDAHSLGDATSKVAKSLGITDYVTTISTACSSGTNAIMLGARLIKSGKLDRVVVGGADCLSKFTINGFKTLMILSDTDGKPFD